MISHVLLELRAGRSLLLNCLLAWQAILTHGQGFLLTPLSRARAIGFDEAEASSGNGLGLPSYRNVPYYQVRVQPPDVCGDPHEGVGTLLLRYIMTPHQATYTAGQVISTTVRTRGAPAGGWISMKLCPTAQVNPSQNCFDDHTLTNADTGFTRWWIQDSGSIVDDVTGTQVHDLVSRWQLPAGVTCGNGCIMQLTYRTASGCVDTCDAAECGPLYATRGNPITGQTRLPTCGTHTAPTPTVFKDCADVLIKAATTTRDTTTSARQSDPTTSQLTSSTGDDLTATARRSRMLVASSSTSASSSITSSASQSASSQSSSSDASRSSTELFSALPPPPPRCGYSAADFCSDRTSGFYGDRCTACTKYYRCGGDAGDAYLSCPLGMAMGTGGSAKECVLPGHGIIC